MADEDEASSHQTKRVFINRIDSYSSKCIAKFLSTCTVGASLEEARDAEMEEEEDSLSKEQKSKVEKGTFEIVGTVSSKDEKKNFSFATEEYYSMNREELLLRLMKCDIIIYNITENTDQIDEASWAISALHADLDNFNDPKMFILISTVMTWGMSKPIDPDQPEIPFTEEDYRRRRPHPNFKDHISVEKLVVKMGKTNKYKFSTYVVASGLQYGMGENIFHFFFKTSWMGEVSEIPVFGAGSNIIPTIHVNDLASVIQNIVDFKPNTHYLVAVDDSKNTLEDIVKVISQVLGPGKIQNVTKEDAFLTKDLTQRDIDSLFVNLRMEAIVLKESLNVHWVCESGIVENINHVVEEYRQTRGLLPIRICILGPPAAGKSTVAEKICKHYKLHHIKVKDTIAECIAHLETLNQLEDEENENDEMAGGSLEFLEGLKENMDQNGGRLDDQFLIRIMRDKLNSTPCRNQGFVLDGFPKTYDQAKELFSADEDEPEDTRSRGPPFNRKIIPEYILSLNATDEFLKTRVLNLPEIAVEGTHYTQDQFPRKLASFRESNVEDETVLNYFDELEIHLEHIDITSSDDLEYLVVMEKIINILGAARNYGLTLEELEEEERRIAEERLKQLAAKKAEIERKEEEEAASRTARWEEWSKRTEEVQKVEQELLEAQTAPLRSYLMNNVMPTLTQGLIECCKAKPDDPVDFLAEYLFKNNPQV
ncbi:adenylate kinase 7 isoform X1 [Anguilla anguilla]|uniref:adenylate kinase 7 isoform X1 n=1 Tax=Anguilla anguilla TaxID=7936 RepID=UPI0015A83C96|nr:adenylate kinase 7 isoform X1 [Anguilla anguilla]